MEWALWWRGLPEEKAVNIHHVVQMHLNWRRGSTRNSCAWGQMWNGSWRGFEAISRVEMYLQRVEDGGFDEVVFFVEQLIREPLKIQNAWSWPWRRSQLRCREQCLVLHPEMVM
jgi:hypothetical protein